jgi:RNA polymerase sigma factor (sigma-70 family)
MSHSLSQSWSQLEDNLPRTRVQVDKLDKLPNNELILLSQSGLRTNRAALAELMRRHQSHVDRILYHLAPDWQDRADLAQEVWIRVYKNIKSLNEPEKFRGWLSRIATNLFYDELRKRKRVAPPLSLDAPINVEDGSIDWEIPSGAPNPSEHLSTIEFYDRLRSAIGNLPEAFRTTIVLREIEGLSYEEIAEVTGVSIGTVKSRIARARAGLQTQLSGYFES